MKTAIKTGMAIIIVVSFFLVLHAQTQQAKPWPVPDKYKAMKSNLKSDDAAAIAVGKELWAKYCKSCHGSKGLGDGPKAAMLKTFPGDFTSAAIQKQTDGEIYYKSFVGRDEMPSFEKKIINESDRWSLVALIRTMK